MLRRRQLGKDGVVVHVAPERWDSMCKGPETSTDQECLRTRRKAGHGDSVSWGIGLREHERRMKAVCPSGCDEEFGILILIG